LKLIKTKITRSEWEDTICREYLDWFSEKYDREDFPLDELYALIERQAELIDPYTDWGALKEVS
jgi:hypothetical protein